MSNFSYDFAQEGSQAAPSGGSSTVQSGTTTTSQSGNFASQSNGNIAGSPQHDSKTTVWMGELEPWYDENFVRQIWSEYGENVSVKMIRDKYSGSNAGYCFIDFASAAAAAKALSLSGTPIPNTNRVFKLNWASGGGMNSKRKEDGSNGAEYSIFVGDLSPETTEYVLFSLFQSRFPSCKSAKIMTDPTTGVSRGYGFVRFADEGEMQRSMTEMQGFYCGNRPMRISTATPKNKAAAAAGVPNGMIPQQGNAGQMGMYQMGMAPLGYYGTPQPINQFTDPNNTTVFVGGLSNYVTEDELRSFFTGFGEITYVKIPPGKGCGFVQFVQRHAAEMAINQMQGFPIGNSRVRLSWGRSQNNSVHPNAAYKASPPPPIYPSLGLPPQHHYSPYTPINPNAAHLHTPQGQQGQVNGGPPNPSIQPSSIELSDPTDPISVSRLNDIYLAARDGQMDRMDAEGHGYHGVYAQ